MVSKRLRAILISDESVSNCRMNASRSLFIGENAVAGMITSLCTGNFLAGYLDYLGADASFCALMGALPQLGCVLQLFSPLLFEHMRHRKPAVILLCFVFRFSLGFSILTPLLFSADTGRLAFIFALYFFAYLSAGFVTPGLNQWMLDLAPQNQPGRYFALRDISSAFCNSVVGLCMGLQLDFFIRQQTPYLGFLVIYGSSVLLAFLDAGLLLAIWEKSCPVPNTTGMRQLLAPYADTRYRPVILYTVLWYFSTNLASPFLSIYLLRYMGLSYTFLSAVGILTLVFGTAGSWIWGHIADKTNWKRVQILTNAVMATVYLAWFFVTPSTAPFAAPVLMGLQTACGGASGLAGLNLQYSNSPSDRRITYLGVTAATGSVFAYTATLIAAQLQKQWETVLAGRSIAVLFFAAALCGGCSMIFGMLRLNNSRGTERSNET